MKNRTTNRTATFARPFRLDAEGDQLPAGRYLVETDEELVDGLSFPFYRRTTTVMQLAPDADRPGTVEFMVIDPEQLEAALARDALPAAQSASPSLLAEQAEQAPGEQSVAAVQPAGIKP